MCSFFVGEISFPLISGLTSSNSFRLATGGSRDRRSDVDSHLPWKPRGITGFLGLCLPHWGAGRTEGLGMAQGWPLGPHPGQNEEALCPPPMPPSSLFPAETWRDVSDPKTERDLEWMVRTLCMNDVQIEHFRDLYGISPSFKNSFLGRFLLLFLFWRTEPCCFLTLCLQPGTFWFTLNHLLAHFFRNYQWLISTQTK